MHFLLRLRETTIFLLPAKNLTPPSCSPTPISYMMQEFWRFDHKYGPNFIFFIARAQNGLISTSCKTDANRFYYLSHAICYSYGADNDKKRDIFKLEHTLVRLRPVCRLHMDRRPKVGDTIVIGIIPVVVGVLNGSKPAGRWCATVV